MNMQDAIRSKEEAEVDDEEEEEAEQKVEKGSGHAPQFLHLLPPSSRLKLLPPRKTQISTTHLLGNSNLSFFLRSFSFANIFHVLSHNHSSCTSTATSGSITFMKINRTL
jgi:hypothetical protein